MLSKELSREKISVSFGVYLSGAEVIREHYPGFIKDRNDMMYMPDKPFQAEGKVLRRMLVGDPLIVAARLLSISKASKKKICFAVGKDASWGELELLSEEQYVKFPCWRKYLCLDHMTFMDDHGIKDVYYLNEVSIEAQL